MLAVGLLGSFRAFDEDMPFEPVRSIRQQELLAYLVLHRSDQISRRDLAFRIWPDTTERQAQTNLRNILHLLKAALPTAERYIETTQSTVRWRPLAPCVVDVALFERALAKADELKDGIEAEKALSEAIAAYRGHLLTGHDWEWIRPLREKLRDQYLDALTRLAELLSGRGRHSEAIKWAQRRLTEDPLSEDAYRTLMLLHLANDDRGSALRAYHSCIRMLDEELGASPSPATNALAGRARGAQGTASSESIDAVPPGTLVGRVEEWQRLRRAWLGVRPGSPAVAVILGEAGMGKTRLAEEILDHAEQNGWTAVRARGYGTAGRLPFAPIVEWLRADQFRVSIRELGANHQSEIARFLPELAAEFPGLPLTAPLTESWQRLRLFDAMAAALSAAGRPLALLLDDLHWVDQESLDFITYFLERHPTISVLLVTAARAEMLAADPSVTDWMRALAARTHQVEIALGPLSRSETQALGEAMLRRPLSPLESDELYAETEGYPLFIVETLRADRPAVSQQITTTDPVQRQIPPGVRAVISARLAQVSVEARALLEVAAVAGRVFSVEMLRLASALDDDALFQGLDELWRRRIIREREASGYGFSHDRLRELAYAELSPPRRRALHRRVAEALASRRQAEEIPNAEVAHHYAAAGDATAAIHHHLAAAASARAVFANRAAIEHLHEVLGLSSASSKAPQQSALLDVHEALGELHLLTGEVGAARSELERAIELSADTLTAAKLHSKVGKAWELARDYRRMLEALTVADRLLGDCDVPLDPGRRKVWVDAQVGLIWAHYWLNEPDAAGEVARKVEHYLIPGEVSPEQIVDFSVASALVEFRRWRYSRWGEVLRLMSGATGSAQRLRDPRRSAMVEFISGFARLWDGDLDAADHHLTASQTLAHQAGDRHLELRATTYLAVVSRRRGSVAGTRAWAEKALEEAEAIDAPDYIGTARANLAWAAWREGETGIATAAALEALAAWSRLPAGGSGAPFQWTALWPLLVMRLDAGDLPGAIECAEQMLDPGQQLLERPLEAAMESAVIACRRGSAAAAAAALRSARNLAHGAGLL